MNVTYRVIKSTLRVRIKIQNIPEGLFDSGLHVEKGKFDAKKQICGDPKIQSYMDSTSESIRKLYEPGMTPPDIWNTLRVQTAKRDSSYLVRDAFEYYMRTSKGAGSTKANIRAVQNKVEKAGLMDKPVKEINGAIVRQLINDVSDYKESTQYETYMKFKTVLNRYLVENGLGSKLPIDGLMKPPKKPKEMEAEYLVWDEVVKLMEVEFADLRDAYFRDMFVLMCLTGMSAGDLLLLRPKKAVSADGRWFQYTRKKTGSDCVSIPLLPQAKQIIERHVWPVMISIRTLQYKCDIISEHIGRKIKTHGARKTFGTIMLEFGYSIETVSKFMGHANPLITAKVYAKVTSDKIQREMNNMPPAVKQLMGI